MSADSRFQERIASRKVATALVSLALAGVLVRLAWLGQRVFYYDESWFGYWVLKFVDHGVWEYRPILHGPFFARVNSVVFPVFGATDFTARLVVALIGGLLPLAAWLLRNRLRDGEVIALGIALAFNPVLLYYSRFMRKDLPLAAFMLVALGFLVRTYETRRPRYLYATGLALGLAFTTKESVLLWVVTWIGAGVLVLDRRLLRARDRDGDPLTAVRSYLIGLGNALRALGGHALAAGGLFLAVVVFFYAPRAGSTDGIGIWRALGGDFGTLPDVFAAATVGSFQKAIDYWASGSIQQHPYLPYLADTLQTLAAGALAVSVLSVVGFVYDRYTGESPRSIVAFSFYGGIAAVLGYPIANNLPVPWSTIHAIVPLTVPAAVGAVAIYRWGRSRLPAREPAVLSGLPVDLPVVRAGLAAAVLTYLVATSGAVAVETSYQAPHESPEGDVQGSEIVYYAQPPAEVREIATGIRESTAAGGDGPDVLFVGSKLAMNESDADLPPPPGAWYARIPLQWYTEAADADVRSVTEAAGIGADPPPVVITTEEASQAVDTRLGDAYVSETYALDDLDDRRVVAFFREGTGPAAGAG